MSIENVIESAYRKCDLSQDDIEIFHVKLTDSALKTLENLSRSKTRPIQLTVEGNHGTLAVSGKPSFHYYNFSISPIPHSTDGALDYVQLKGNRVNSIGKPASRLTIQANNDSFVSAKLKMSEAEKEQRLRQSKGPLIANGKRPDFRNDSMNSITVPTPPGSRHSDSRISPSLINGRSYSPLCMGSNKSPINPTMDVASRSLRDRIIHLLAVQSYHRPELLLRLTKDGLTSDQKDQIDPILSKVGRPGRQGEYYLAATFFNLIETSWPGYSPSERSTATSKKAMWQSSSPTNRLLLTEVASRVTPQRHSNSPSNSGITAASVDEFGRKPTRASAPHAPHSITKKIAALDLLATGVSEAVVATKYGITMTLLGNWKNAETSLRQQYAQRQGGSVADSHIPLQRTGLSDTQTAENSPSFRKQPLPPTRAETPINSSNRPVKDTKSFHCVAKRPRLSEDYQLSDTTKPFSSSNVKISRKPSSPVIKPQQKQQPLPPPEPIETKSTFQQFSRCPPLSSSGFCETTVAGSSCDSAYYTTPTSGGGGPIPPSNSAGFSSGGSGGVGVRSSLGNHGVYAIVRRRRARDCGSETSSCSDSSVPSPETPPQRTVKDDQLNKRQFTQHCLEDKSSEPSDEEGLYPDITSETEEFERQFPEIQTAHQASIYRKEFETIYPTYRQLYDSIRNAWNTVNSLKIRVLKAMHEDSSRATKIACTLDEFIKGMRAPERREEEMQLALMTSKLRLLKQRLASFTETTSPKLPYVKSQRVSNSFRT